MQVDDHDYPALFWIQKSLNEGFRRMGDLGGNIGIKYYAFGDKISWPPDFRWTVIDLPAVVAEGVRFAGFRGQAVAQLDFSSETKDLEGVDLLLASGVLQYLPFTLGEMLDTLETKPRRILVNTTPLHETRDYFTLNNIGTALCPYRVQSRALFVQEIEARGYRLRDQWSNIGKRLTLSYEAGYSLDHYSGYCFDRT
jgi:putative methyltransferase (TIGR04325 family)